jgi:2-polyprenyl-3-methyl-5-hydroxy-6-metoxy-1,4-benzoquinol methylase
MSVAEWDISHGGERVTHLYPNDCYYAHLSVYWFAATYAADARVLDAGSGAGYGAAYLADHGARSVLGAELDPQAVAFSRAHFQRPNLSFEALELSDYASLGRSAFDLAVCSNVLEHVGDVAAALRALWGVLAPTATLILAVPPILSEELRLDNLANPYHLNIWTPRQWRHALSLFFADIQPFRHVCARPDVMLDFSNAPEQTTIREHDFVFEPCAPDDPAYQPTLSALFVVRGPLPEQQLPAPGQAIDLVDDSLTISEHNQIAQLLSRQLGNHRRIIAELSTYVAKLERAARHGTQLEQQVVLKNAHIADLERQLSAIEQGRALQLLRQVSRLLKR